MLNELVAFVILIVVGFIYLRIVLLSDKRSCKVLKAWIDSTGYELIERRYPYPWETAFYRGCKGRPIHMIKVIDKKGEIRSGEIEFGNCLTGESGRPGNLEVKLKWHSKSDA